MYDRDNETEHIVLSTLGIIIRDVNFGFLEMFHINKDNCHKLCTHDHSLEKII